MEDLLKVKINYYLSSQHPFLNEGQLKYSVIEPLIEEALRMKKLEANFHAKVPEIEDEELDENLYLRV